MAAFTRTKRLFETSKERPFVPSVFRTARLILTTGAKDALVSRRFRIINQGTLRLQRRSRLGFGTGFYGFLDGSEPALIRNRGLLECTGAVSVGGGARWDIGPDAVVAIGDGTHFSPKTMIVSSRGISNGERCAVGWDVQILDSDFHSHGLADSAEAIPPAPDFSSQIDIGNHVWVGSGVRIFKGVQVAGDCIIAGGGAVVTSSVLTSGSLIAGNPARVIKTGVVWR